MDAFQLIVTTTAVIIVLLLMVYFACQLGPRANAWLRSTREEKIGLSHKKLYNANGYLIRSGSEFLLSSSGSFKRFDSVDRDCKQQDARNSPAPSTSSAVSPLWTLSAANIPGQPLRPAPSPPPSASATTHKLQFFGTQSLEQGQQQQQHHHPIKQQSWAGRCASPSPTAIVSTSTAAIPRPTAKRQLSTPASICYSPIKLRSPKLSREATNTNPFLEVDAEKETITAAVATETANPSSLPDLVSDSPVVLCRRLQSPIESATQPRHLNPFCADPGYQVKERNSFSEEQKPEGSLITNSAVVVLPENPAANVKPVTRERLIFNFDNAIVGGGEYTVAESATSEVVEVNGENMYLRGCGDLISLDMADEEGGRGVLGSSGAREVGSASDENVINALREAEGSIRKLELEASTRHEVEQGRSEDMIEKYSFEHGSAAKHFLIHSSHETATDSPYHELDVVDYNNRMSKYEDSLASDSHEELLLMNCQRRFRSHSETEATISIFDRLLSQQRRMMLSSNNPNNNYTNIAHNSNNPFFSPDLLQSHDNHLMRSSHRVYPNNCNSGGGGGGCVSNFSPARTPLIRSNGMMIKQNLQQQEQQHQTQRRGSHGSTTKSDANINPFTPLLSKTVSETYLGQFMATSALPRSSSILQLLEQHQQPPPSPTLPSSAWAFGDGSSGRCAVGGGGKERNGSSNSCMKSSWSKHSIESGDGIPKVNVFANSCAAAGGNFKRTLSSESVSSQSSVLIADLESTSEQPARYNRLSTTTPPVTGYLCVGLQYDKNNANEEGAELIVTVLEAKELLGPVDISSSSTGNTSDAMDTFVRIYLVPDEERAMQTKLFKNSTCPSYNETFSFWVSRKHHRHSLWFHLYHSGFNQHTLIGEGELQIGDAKRPLTTWLALSDSRHSNSSAANFGELMFSLSYLPTAERLTVVVVKGRNLQFEGADGERGEEGDKPPQRDKRNSISTPSTQTQDLNDELSSASSSSLCDLAEQLARKRNSCTAADAVANVMVKVYLLKDGKKVSKKKTTIKRMESSPIYNESMIFSVPPYMLGAIQIRLTVAQIVVAAEYRRMQIMPIGHVIVGNEATGKGLKHWNQMMTSLRKPVAMWHPLRRCPKESSSGTSGTSVEAESENKK